MMKNKLHPTYVKGILSFILVSFLFIGTGWHTAWASVNTHCYAFGGGSGADLGNDQNGAPDGCVGENTGDHREATRAFELAILTPSKKNVDAAERAYNHLIQSEKASKAELQKFKSQLPDLRKAQIAYGYYEKVMAFKTIDHGNFHVLWEDTYAEIQAMPTLTRKAKSMIYAEVSKVRSSIYDEMQTRATNIEERFEKATTLQQMAGFLPEIQAYRNLIPKIYDDSYIPIATKYNDVAKDNATKAQKANALIAQGITTKAKLNEVKAIVSGASSALVENLAIYFASMSYVDTLFKNAYKTMEYNEFRVLNEFIQTINPPISSTLGNSLKNEFQSKINEKNNLEKEIQQRKINAVQKLENLGANATLKDIVEARKVVAKLPDTEKDLIGNSGYLKASLTNRIDEVEKKVLKNKEQDYVDNYLDKVKQNEKQKDLEELYAQIRDNPDTSMDSLIKNELMEGVRNQANAVLQKAKDAVSLAESFADKQEGFDYYIRAINLTSNLEDSSTKTQLLQRLEVVKNKLSPLYDLGNIERIVKDAKSRGYYDDYLYAMRTLNLYIEKNEGSSNTTLLAGLQQYKQELNTLKQSIFTRIGNDIETLKTGGTNESNLKKLNKLLVEVSQIDDVDASKRELFIGNIQVQREAILYVNKANTAERLVAYVNNNLSFYNIFVAEKQLAAWGVSPDSSYANSLRSMENTLKAQLKIAFTTYKDYPTNTNLNQLNKRMGGLIEKNDGTPYIVFTMNGEAWSTARLKEEIKKIQTDKLASEMEKEAEKYMYIAEESATKTNVINANNYVNRLTVNSAKRTELRNRLQTLNNKVYATVEKQVEKAEDTLSKADFKKANDYLSFIVPEASLNQLKNRLRAIADDVN